MTPLQLPRRRAPHRLAACGAAIAAGAAWAQATYPSKTVSIVVPFGGGTPTTRWCAISPIDCKRHRPAIRRRRQARGTGRHRGLVRGACRTRRLHNPVRRQFDACSQRDLFKKLAYDPVADFAPVTTLATIPQVLVVSPSLNVKNLQEFIALARSKPGQLNYGSSSATGRVASVAFRQLAGIEAVHVPYRTSAQAITDLISGQLHLLVTDAGLGVAEAQVGRVRHWASVRRAAWPARPICRRSPKRACPATSSSPGSRCSYPLSAARWLPARRADRRGGAQPGHAGIPGQDCTPSRSRATRSRCGSWSSTPRGGAN